MCTENEAIIDWSQPSAKVYNLIRGTNPQPGATTYLRGVKLKIFDSALINVSQDKLPGVVNEITEKGITLAGKGGAILVKRLQPVGSAKITAAEYTKAVALKAGDCFGR